LGLNEVSGNYVVSYRETTENEEIESLLTHPIKLVSVDSKFENIKTNQFECKYPIMSLISDEKDTLVFNLVDKLLFVDKNLNMSEKKGIDGTNILSYQNNKLYYIVDKNHIGILDYKTNKTSKFKIDFNMFNTKIDFLDLQILGDKLFVITFDEIRVYDDSGNLVKKYSYDNLNVSFDSDNNDEATPVNYMIIDKVDNQLHIQTILNGYLMTEKYDTNGELIYRKVFGQNYNDYGVTNRDDTYMMGNNHMTNIQFSDKYEVFIKRDMLQE
jgi:hypothetical protein